MNLADLVAQGMEHDTGIRGVRFRDHALGHRRQDHGNLVRLGETQQIVPKPCAHGTEPQHESRLACIGECGPGHRESFLRCNRRLFHVSACAFGQRCGLGGQVHRHPDMHRTRTPRGRDLKGLVQRLGHVVRGQAGSHLGDRSHQRLMVDIHLHHAVAIGRRHLIGQCDQRRTVELGRTHPGGKVRGAGPKGRETHPRNAGQPTGHIGHETGTAFMRRQDKVDAVGVANGLHEVDPTAAGDPENMFDAAIPQAFDHCLSYFFCHGFRSRR